MQRFGSAALLAIGLLLAASACGPSFPVSLLPTLAPAGTPTADPCRTENLPSTIEPLNDLMRQFDDYAALASSIVQSQLVQVIPPMQEIRRAAQDQAAPACLADLKRFELLYMDTTLQTLLAFQKPNPSASSLATGIIQARAYHDQYTRELARLLGVTLPAPAGTPTLIPTP